jgi:hypothetical protein
MLNSPSMTDTRGLQNDRVAWHEEGGRRLRRTEGERQLDGNPIPLLEGEQVSDLDSLGGVTLKKVPATWEIRENDLVTSHQVRDGPTWSPTPRKPNSHSPHSPQESHERRSSLSQGEISQGDPWEVDTGEWEMAEMNELHEVQGLTPLSGDAEVYCKERRKKRKRSTSFLEEESSSEP